jgi:hypothetical protein
MDFTNSPVPTDRQLLERSARARQVLRRLENDRPDDWRRIVEEGRRAFDLLYHRYYDAVYTYLLARMRREEAGQFHADFEDAIQQAFLEVALLPPDGLHADLGGILRTYARRRLYDTLARNYRIRARGQDTGAAAITSRRGLFNNAPQGVLENQQGDGEGPLEQFILQEEASSPRAANPAPPAALAVDPRLRTLLEGKPPEERVPLEGYYLLGRSIDELVASRPDGTVGPGLYERWLCDLFVEFARQVYRELPDGERVLAALLRRREGRTVLDPRLREILGGLPEEERDIVRRYCFDGEDMDDLVRGRPDEARRRRMVHRTVHRFYERVREEHPDGEEALRNHFRGLRRQLIAAGLDVGTLDSLEGEWRRREADGSVRSRLLIGLNRARTHLLRGRSPNRVQEQLETLLRAVRQG